MAKKKKPECKCDLVTIKYKVHQMNKTKVGLRPVFMVCDTCGKITNVRCASGITLTTLEAEDAENSEATA